MPTEWALVADFNDCQIPVARDHLQLRTKSVNQDRTINEMAVKIAEVEAEARKRQNAQMDADRLQAEVGPRVAPPARSGLPTTKGQVARLLASNRLRN